MSVVSNDVTDQLFVLALDLVTRISIQEEMRDDEVFELQKQCISNVSNGVCKAALMQKLLQRPYE